MVKNRVFALCFRSAAFLFCFISILHNIGVFAGEITGVSLLYYTLQSNILVIIMFGILTYKTAVGLKKDGRCGSCSYYPRICAAVLLAIILTLIVFWALLAPVMEIDYLPTFSNLSVHLIAPLLMLADYILFTESGKLKKRDPFIFTLVPVLYLIQATILGFAGVNYQPDAEKAVYFPYFFMDYYETGAWVALYIVAIAAFYIGLGYLLWFIDYKRGKKTENTLIDK